MELVVRDGDIAALEVDAIANAANDRLWMGSGVAGALKRAGGEEIERAALAKGSIPVGSAVATTAGRLRARWVVHGAVMGQDLRTSVELVRTTTRSCLAVADELGCASLALPAFGTGVGGLSLIECAAAMIDEVRAFVPHSLRRVIFAVHGADARRAFEDGLRGYEGRMREEDEEGGRFAVRGEDSIESKETLSPDEGGDDPREPPSQPKQPSPKPPNP